MSQIKERPILFSAPLVRAILEGRKTVTRRAISHKLANRFDEPRGQADVEAGYPVVECEEGYFPATNFCPYGQPGDRLWVRESLGYDCEYGHYFAAGGRHGETVYLCSLFDNEEEQIGPSYDGLLPERSVPSIHLHRRYSRILLEITDVRVERLQDISDEQALAEGIIPHVRGGWHWHLHDPANVDDWHQFGFKTPYWAFHDLWAGINGADSWNANPWVWVVEFKQVTP